MKEKLAKRKKRKTLKSTVLKSARHCIIKLSPITNLLWRLMPLLNSYSILLCILYLRTRVSKHRK